MKFPQLPIGARFTFKGKTYSKTGPLSASEASTGKSQLMMKSAVVNPLDVPETPTGRKERQFSESEVRQLCADQLKRLRKRVEALATGPEGLSLAQTLKLLDDLPMLPD